MKMNLRILFPRKKYISLVLVGLSLFLVAACANKEERKQKYYDRGMTLFNQGNFTKARLEFKNVLQIDPKDANAYYMFGQIEEKDENWSKAYALHLTGC